MDTETTQDAQATLPYNYAKRHGVFLERGKGKSCIYYRTGVQIAIVQEVGRRLGWNLPHRTLGDAEFTKLLQKNYTETERSEASAISDEALKDERVNFGDINTLLEEPDDLLNTEDDAPIIKLFNALLFEAIREKASDIHIEPYSEKLIIRFRLDGVLKSSLSTQVKIAPFLVTRIKVLARLDIAEKRGAARWPLIGPPGG